MNKAILIAAALIAILAAAAVASPFAGTITPSDDAPGSIPSGDGGLGFHGEGNGSCYVVTVFSPNPIHITNGSFRTRGILDQPTECTNVNICGYFIMNSSTTRLMAFQRRRIDPSRLRYVSVNVGPFNYTYQNLNTDTISGVALGSRQPIRNRTLPPGTWHFILTGALFDAGRQPSLHHEVWLNFSQECQDVIVNTVSGGTVYALSFTDFPSSITVSKNRRLELMVNGRATFHVNHSFVYSYVGFFFSDGILKAEMTLPNGSVRSAHLVMARERAVSVDIEKGCLHGVGGSGIYCFNVSYLNYRPLLNFEDTGLIARPSTSSASMSRCPAG